MIPFFFFFPPLSIVFLLYYMLNLCRNFLIHFRLSEIEVDPVELQPC